MITLFDVVAIILADARAERHNNVRANIELYDVLGGWVSLSREGQNMRNRGRRSAATTPPVTRHRMACTPEGRNLGILIIHSVVDGVC